MKKRFFIRASIFLFIFVFCFYDAIWGSFGFKKYLQTKKDVAIKENKVLSLQNKIDKLDKSIQAWKSDVFKVEKTARQKLLMGSKEETIYLVT